MFELSPLPYHRRVRDLVRSEEGALWDWFASDRFAEDCVDSVRLELLKSTYRMEPEAHPGLYEAGAKALEALGLDIPVAFYQAQQAGGMNAALCFLPGEAHVVLQGPVQATLSPAELTALVGHELAHYKLWTLDGGAHRITMNLVEAMAGHPGAEPSHVNTALRLRRYTEVYADRGALLASNDPFAAIGCLVKVQTGLTDVDARAYLKQAEEVLRRGGGASEGETHPEAFIRARALWLWHQDHAASDAEISKLIHEVKSLEDLDLLDQVELTKATRSVIQELLQPSWLCTERVISHARLFFSDFSPRPAASQERERLKLSDALKEYVAYVLLDFAAADPDLGDVSVAYTMKVAEDLGCGASFEKAARKELKLTKREIEMLRVKLPMLVEKAQSQEGPPA